MLWLQKVDRATVLQPYSTLENTESLVPVLDREAWSNPNQRQEMCEEAIAAAKTCKGQR